MRKMLLSILLLCLSTVMMSKEDVNLLKDAHNLDFYGVDFSLAKVYGANETALQFAAAFKGINTLLVAEQSKYNLEKYLLKDDVALHLKHLKTSYDKIVSDDNLEADDDYYAISVQNIEAQIQGYNVDYKYEIGAVLIAELLNKGAGYATYYLTFFDNNTKKIIATYPMTCRIGGFGLRNYWAKSVLEALKKAQIEME